MRNEIKLIDKFLNKRISVSEREVLKNWVSENDNNLNEFKKRIKEFEATNLAQFEVNKAYQNFISEIRPKKITVISFRPYLKYAAIFAGLIFFGSLYNIISEEKSTHDILIIEKNSQTKKSIKIVLADGTVKILDGKQKEDIIDKNGNLIAKKEENVLSFNSKNDNPTTTPKINEISIPNGQKFKMRLADGTIVWLNSGSTLKFPENFNGLNDTRSVSLTGEAYFDVAKNENKPFIVSVDAIDVLVLGTKFNVSSYENDRTIQTTLIEGSVNIYKKNVPQSKLKLSPNFQATFNKDLNDLSLSESLVDTDLYTAWMQNRIIINNLKFSEILKRLERTHNVIFINEAKNINNEVYKGEFENENIVTILETIALSTPFTYSMNKNIITISAK